MPCSQAQTPAFSAYFCDSGASNGSRARVMVSSLSWRSWLLDSRFHCGRPTSSSLRLSSRLAMSSWKRSRSASGSWAKSASSSALPSFIGVKAMLLLSRYRATSFSSASFSITSRARS
ncbi:hypothetical protein D3C86_1657860 [compost metagenome]